jgi:hypothetical protein
MRRSVQIFASNRGGGGIDFNPVKLMQSNVRVRRQFLGIGKPAVEESLSGSRVQSADLPVRNHEKVACTARGIEERQGTEVVEKRARGIGRRYSAKSCFEVFEEEGS